MEQRFDVIVVGAGQAGLAMGYFLARQGLRFALFDRAPRVGHVWRNRWDSLTLFTPGGYSGLPGLPFPGEAERTPTREEVADYLEAYAHTFDLPLRLGEEVVALRAAGAGEGFLLETPAARYRADQVVVATGPFQTPFVPPIAAALAPEVFQVHSSTYRNPDQLPPGDVLVVGGGNSGVQIAEELARSRRTCLSVGSRLGRLPERFLGRSIFWWMERLGMLDITAESAIGRRVRERELLIGKSLAMLARDAGVEVVGRTVAASGGAVTTGDGRTLRVASVVWATGFRFDFRWIHVPVFDERGRPVHRRGVTAAPGLYFLGLPWLQTRGSALIGWVGRDAAWLARRIGSRAATPALAAR